MTTTELARREFKWFIDYTNRDFVWAAHHLLIAEKLQQVVDGEIKRLYIGMPPRHGKSEMASIRLALFYLGRYPDREIIHVSYSAALSNEFSRKIRAIVRDDVNFHTLFPDCQLDPERQNVADWRTTAGGGFLSVGVGGGITGHGAHLEIFDDPHKEGDQLSPATLELVFDWYSTAAQTRLAPGAAIVFPMTRWHPNDLAGRVLKLAQENPLADQWEQLVLPALAEENDPLGRLPGQALWPERFDETRLAAIRSVSESAFQALFQQNPLAFEGALFLESDFRRESLESFKTDYANRAYTFDLAIKEDEKADYTRFACSGYDRASGLIAFANFGGFRLEWPEAIKEILKLIDADPEADFVFSKDNHELLAVQQLKRLRPQAKIHGIFLPGDKRSRASVLADRGRSGLVVVQSGPEGDSFIRECVDFGSASHDDWVDMSSVATHWHGLHRDFEALIKAVDSPAPEREGRELLERFGLT